MSIIRATQGKPKAAAKPRPDAAAVVRPTDVNVYVASAYAAWQRPALALLATLHDPEAHGVEGGGFPADVLSRVKALAAGDAALKPVTKKVMEFAALTVAAHKERGGRVALPALRLELPFDEVAVWRANAEYVTKSLDVPALHVIDVSADPAAAASDPTGRAKEVVPGEPAVHAFVRA